MVSIRDTAMLQRREFKIHGGQIGDSVSDIRFSNLCKQIDEGIKEGYTESDIIRGVLRMIKPGNFKDMLITKDDELRTAKQHDHETPQQLLYRMISLKQKILFCSRQVNSDIKYDDHTVQSVFIHTVSQGIGPKHSDIRQELRPFLSDSSVSDETLLRHVIRITSDESDRQRWLGQSTHHKVVHAQFESDSGAKEMVRMGETTKDKTIQQLREQIGALTTAVDSLIRSGMPKFPNSRHEYTESQPKRHQNPTPQQHPTPFLPSAKPLYDPDTQELEVRDVKNDVIPFHGWVEITLNLLGNEDPRLAIHVPFLVSRIGLERPILGFNVVQEIIRGGENRTQTLFTLANLLSTAMEIEEDKANVLINLIQYQETSNELDLDIQVPINVGPQDVVILSGCVTHVKCRVPDNFVTPVRWCCSNLSWSVHSWTS
ncbi:hypothetical protein M9458_054585 [Cirrhinus mrigala]|uniref:Uncharacterized protein n=1 Tax=Cirrhinus mrigala TaxID=683832 RepID=A0ABD0MJ06_CIRMR